MQEKIKALEEYDEERAEVISKLLEDM